MNRQTAAHKALAAIVKKHRDTATENEKGWPLHSAERNYWTAQRAIMWTVAEEYADATGVDKIKFMAECGIDAS